MIDKMQYKTHIRQIIMRCTNGIWSSKKLKFRQNFAHIVLKCVNFRALSKNRLLSRESTKIQTKIARSAKILKSEVKLTLEERRPFWPIFVGISGESLQGYIHI